MEEDIIQCLETLKRGGIILYPTDTVWGIGCDARNEKAVERIYQIKKRSDSKSLIVLVDNDSMLNKHVSEVPEVAWDMIEFSEKPLTVIYDKAFHLAENVIAPDGSCGIRITTDDFCKKLIHKFGRPVVSTSANISGENTPQNFSDISPEIKNQVDYIVKHRQHDPKKSKPSTIIRIKNNGEFSIIRK